MTKNPPFHGQRLVFCEGIEDAAFLRHLRDKRGLGEFDIRAVQDFGGPPGIDGFAPALINSAPLTGFALFRHIVLVADSDEQHGNSFSKICAQLKKANRHQNVNDRFALPDKPFIASGGHPRMTVVLMPSANSKGALETLLCAAIKSIPKYDKAMKCAEAACACADIHGKKSKWTKSKADKAMLRIFMAVAHRENPSLGLGRLWSQAPDLIPIDNSAFDEIDKFLRAIS